MSQVIQNAEKRIAEAKKTIHDEKLKNARQALIDAVKSNATNEELGRLGMSLRAIANPPSAMHKSKSANPTVPIV